MCAFEITGAFVPSFQCSYFIWPVVNINKHYKALSNIPFMFSPSVQYSHSYCATQWRTLGVWWTWQQVIGGDCSSFGDWQETRGLHTERHTFKWQLQKTKKHWHNPQHFSMFLMKITDTGMSTVPVGVESVSVSVLLLRSNLWLPPSSSEAMVLWMFWYLQNKWRTKLLLACEVCELVFKGVSAPFT